jgi:adenosylcobinamide-phosphate synthase
MVIGARAAGLCAGFALDLALADPRRGHPVAGFGALARALERRTYADSRAAGAAYTATLVGGSALVGQLLSRRVAGSGLGEVVLVAASTYAVLGGTSLVREGDRMATLLTADDLSGARARLSHLCARDGSQLAAPELARATVESVAENTSDAVVAPLFWGALLGVPGLLGYRAANTLDAMVGYRSSRYARFGWASARLDDLLNVVPARLAALLTALVSLSLAPLKVWWRDAHRHPSPNAGPVEAAYAGALGVRLGGSNVYDGVEEARGELGSGRPVEVHDVRRANLLSRRVSAAALVACVLIASRR